MDERLLGSPVFRDFASEEVVRFLECAEARSVRMEKGGQMSGGQTLGVLLSGSLCMTRYDAFGNRFLLENIEAGEVFKRGEVHAWKCNNCGHIHIGPKAPEVCPVCAHPQAYFQLRAENY